MAVLVVLTSWGAVGCDDDAKGAATGDVVEMTDAKHPPDGALGGESADANTGDPHPTASSPGGATVADQPPLDPQFYLTIGDVEELAGMKVAARPLVGKKPSADYNAVRLAPRNKNGYGASLQLWKVGDQQAAVSQVAKMRRQYLNAQPAPKHAPLSGDEAFGAQRGGIRTYVVATDSDEVGYVAAISCGRIICGPSWAGLNRLARKVLSRIEDPGERDDMLQERRDRAERRRESAEKTRDGPGAAQQRARRTTEQKARLKRRRNRDHDK